MTLKELEEQLGIPRAVALRLARMIPGAKKEAAGPGQIPRWVIPDDALSQITEEMLEAAARAEPAHAGAVPAPDPALAEEERAVKRARLEADRLRAEADRLKAEEEVERLRERRGARSDPSAALVDRLEDRLDRLERAVQDGAHPDPTAPMAEMVMTIMAPLIEKLAAPPPPAPTQPSLSDLLGIVEKVRSLAGPPENMRREIREAYRDGVEDGGARAAARTGEGPSAWGDVLRSLPEMIRTGQELGLLRPSAPVTAGGPAAPPPPPAPPAARATVTVQSGEPVAPGQDPRIQAALGAVLLLLRQGIEKGSEDLELYASLVDEHLPRFLDEWTALDQEQAIASLAQADPFFGEPRAVEWLRRWWRFLREEYLEEEPGPKANDGGERR